MDAINGLSKLNSIINNTNNVKSNTKVTGNNFSDFLVDALEKVNEAEIESNKLDELLAVGEVENLHEVMIASQKAEIVLNLAVEVRNKLTDAYKEIMRIQF